MLTHFLACLATPGACGMPNVDSVGRDFANLSWEAPKRDGGARITGYLVEKRQRGSPNWEPATSNPVIGTSANISGLPTGEEFEFRVIPINGAGAGEPSNPSAMTKIEDKRGKWSTPYVMLLSMNV